MKFAIINTFLINKNFKKSRIKFTTNNEMTIKNIINSRINVKIIQIL